MRKTVPVGRLDLGLGVALRTGERGCRGGEAADYARAINISSNNPIAWT